MKKIFLLATAPLLFIEACSALRQSEKKENARVLEISKPALVEMRTNNNNISLIVWDTWDGEDLIINSGTITIKPRLNYGSSTPAVSRIKTESVIEVIN